MFHNKYISRFKVAVLIIIVILAFYFSSIGWRHLDTTDSVRIIVGSCILLVMYILMIFELVNRNLAALIGAAASVAAYDCLVEYAKLEDILAWEDLETLSLLFGMMTIVSVLRYSGLFNYLAIWSYKKSNGHFWLLIITMSTMTAFISAFIDNVSTMLLISPTLIKLSELEHIDPKFIIMIMLTFCNIGGCATPVGDPPNLIIIGDPIVSSLSINFGSFVAYNGPCVLIIMVVIYFYLKIVYKSKESFRPRSAIMRKKSMTLALTTLDGSTNLVDTSMRDTITTAQAAYFEPGLHNRSKQQLGIHLINKRDADLVDEIVKLTRELNVLKGCLQKMNESRDLPKFSQDTLKIGHNVSNRIEQIEETIQYLNEIRNKRNKQQQQPGEHYMIECKQQKAAVGGSRLTLNQINELMQRYSIKSWPILYMSMSVLVFAVIFFFVQAIPDIKLTLGWVSLFAALLLLVSSSMEYLPPDSEIESDKDEDPIVREQKRRENHQEQALRKNSEIQDENFNRVVAGVEWPTLMFFFALFIVMEVMGKLGVIRFLGIQITRLVDLIPSGPWRVAGSITIILWSCGIASAFIDNVPFTTMMIKILGTMLSEAQASHSPDLSSIKALVFSLAFGACLGGNSTIIGASANIVAVNVASTYGHTITFKEFTRFNGPITVIALAIANVYLIVIFVFLDL